MKLIMDEIEFVYVLTLNIILGLACAQTYCITIQYQCEVM
jgi:hypothetical protein